MTFYVLDENNNKVEAFDKEGVLAVLAQAISDGSLNNIVADAAFISKIKCCVSGDTHNMAFVTQAKYNELVAAKQLLENTYYWITDDSTCEDLDETLEALTTAVNDLSDCKEVAKEAATKAANAETKANNALTKVNEAVAGRKLYAATVTITNNYDNTGLTLPVGKTLSDIRSVAFEVAHNNFNNATLYGVVCKPLTDGILSIDATGNYIMSGEFARVLEANIKLKEVDGVIKIFLDSGNTRYRYLEVTSSGNTITHKTISVIEHLTIYFN